MVNAIPREEAGSRVKAVVDPVGERVRRRCDGVSIQGILGPGVAAGEGSERSK